MYVTDIPKISGKMRMSKIKIYYEICKSNLKKKKTQKLFQFCCFPLQLSALFSASFSPTKQPEDKKMLFKWKSSIVKSFKSQT